MPTSSQPSSPTRGSTPSCDGCRPGRPRGVQIVIRRLGVGKWAGAGELQRVINLLADLLLESIERRLVLPVRIDQATPKQHDRITLQPAGTLGIRSAHARVTQALGVVVKAVGTNLHQRRAVA